MGCCLIDENVFNIIDTQQNLYLKKKLKNFIASLATINDLEPSDTNYTLNTLRSIQNCHHGTADISKLIALYEVRF